jgi:hypothetical protein
MEVKNYRNWLFNSILFNERIMMAITHEDDFESRAAGEWRNSSERVIIDKPPSCISLTFN